MQASVGKARSQKLVPKARTASINVTRNDALLLLLAFDSTQLQQTLAGCLNF